MTDAFDLSKFTKAKVQKPSELTLPQMVALYGKAGSGKTWLAASEALHYQELNNGKKVLLIDTEGSATGTVVGLPDDFIDILPVEDPLELRALVQGLIQKEHDYGTVIIDTWDVYHDEYIERLKKVTKNDKGQIDTRAAWGVLKVEQLAMINKLKKAKFRVILVIHDRVEKLPNGVMYKGLAISGSTKDVLPGKPDMIGYTTRYVDDNKQEITVVDFTPGTTQDTKNRFSLSALKNPTMSVIYDTITKKQQEKTK